MEAETLMNSLRPRYICRFGDRLKHTQSQRPSLGPLLRNTPQAPFPTPPPRGGIFKMGKNMRRDRDNEREAGTFRLHPADCHHHPKTFTSVRCSDTMYCDLMIRCG